MDAVEVMLKISDKEAISQLADIEKRLYALQGLGPSTGQSVSGGLQNIRNNAASTNEVATLLKNTLSALGAGFGISEMIRFGKALLDTQIQLDKARNAMTLVAGSAAYAKGEMEWLRAESDRVGINFIVASQAFAKFASATRGTGISMSQVRETFIAVAEASTRMGLTVDQQQSVFLALEQMVSKGTVSMQELKLQLANSLPGATAIAARSLGVTQKELYKLVESGQLLTSDFLPKFTAQLQKDLPLGAAAESAAAKVNRLSNAWTDFKANIGNSGVMVAVVSAMTAGVKGLEDVFGAADRVVDGLTTISTGPQKPAPVTPDEVLGPAEFVSRANLFPDEGTVAHVNRLIELQQKLKAVQQQTEGDGLFGEAKQTAEITGLEEQLYAVQVRRSMMEQASLASPKAAKALEEEILQLKIQEVELTGKLKSAEQGLTKEQVDKQLSNEKRSLELKTSALAHGEKAAALLQAEVELRARLGTMDEKSYAYQQTKVALDAMTIEHQREQVRQHEEIERVDRQIADAQVARDNVGKTTSQQIWTIASEILRLKSRSADMSLTELDREKSKLDVINKEKELREKVEQQRQSFLNSGTDRGIQARTQQNVAEIQTNPYFTQDEQNLLIQQARWAAAEEQRQAARARTNAALTAGDRTYTQSFIDGLRLQVDAWGNAQQQMSAIGSRLADDLAEGPAEAFMEFQKGTKSATQAFSDMAISIADDIEKMIVKMLLMQAIQSGMSYLGFGGFGGGALHASGSSDTSPYIPRFHAGSPQMMQDEVPIIAKRGEPIFVQSQQQTKDSGTRNPIINNQVTAVIVDSPERAGQLIRKNPHWIWGAMDDKPQ